MTGPQDESSPQVVVVQPARRPRWHWYREVVLVLLAFAVLMLVLQGNRDRAQIQALTHKLDQSTTTAMAERSVLQQQLLDITQRLADTNRVSAAQNAEIKRLNALVIALGGDPTPPSPLPTLRPTAESDPSPLPGPSPSPASSPSPTPTPAGPPPLPPRPSPRPSPTASASPTPTPCTAEVLGVCLVR